MRDYNRLPAKFCGEGDYHLGHRYVETSDKNGCARWMESVTELAYQQAEYEENCRSRWHETLDEEPLTWLGKCDFGGCSRIAQSLRLPYMNGIIYGVCSKCAPSYLKQQRAYTKQKEIDDDFKAVNRLINKLSKEAQTRRVKNHG